MAVRSIWDVRDRDLKGLFVCEPAKLADKPFGMPCVIIAAHPRTVWVAKLCCTYDLTDCEWKFLLSRRHVCHQNEEKRYRKASLMVVCDTAEEAITMFRRASKIHEFITEQRKQIDRNYEHLRYGLLRDAFDGNLLAGKAKDGLSSAIGASLMQAPVEGESPS